MVEMWRGVSNGVLFNIQFEPRLDDELAEKAARSLLTEPLFDLSPEEEYAALARALESDETLTDGIPGVPHSERDYRDFLRRLLNQLDAMRPWPELPFRRLDVSEWDRFGGARPVARIRLNFAEVQGRVRRAFSRLEGTHRLAMLLRFTSGTEIALVTPWWHGSDDVAVLSNTPGKSPGQVVAELTSTTGLTPDEIALLN